MENIKDDYIIRSMMDTGYPPWMQETVDGYEDDDNHTIEEIPESCVTVLNHIGFGKQNACPRVRLAELTGMNDRQMRRCIEILRRDFIILNDQDGKGYYRPADAKEVRRYYYQELNRVRAIDKRLRLPRKYLISKGML